MRHPRSGTGKRGLAVSQVVIVGLLCIASATAWASSDESTPFGVPSTEQGIHDKLAYSFPLAWDARHCPASERAERAVLLYHKVWLGWPPWDFNETFPSSIPDDATAADIMAGKYGRISESGLWLKTNQICVSFFVDERKTLLPVIRGEIEQYNGGPSRALAVISYLHGGAMSISRRMLPSGRFVLDEKSQPIWTEVQEALYPAMEERFRALRETVPKAERLAYALRDLDDPRAIDLLLEKDAEQAVLRYFELLGDLQLYKTANPRLVALLSSENANVRAKATEALSRSGDPELLPQAIKLMSDPNPRVREPAVLMARLLPDTQFAATYDARRKLLTDEDPKVRFAAVESFAFKKDPVCGKALLDLLRGMTLGPLFQSNLVDRMQELTGNRFGYQIGTDVGNTISEKNKAALDAFERWIEAHSAAPEPPKGAQ